jgi:hypothetical protein
MAKCDISEEFRKYIADASVKSPEIQVHSNELCCFKSQKPDLEVKWLNWTA